MRIPKERRDARIRVSKTQLLILEALEKAAVDIPDLTETDILLALVETTRQRVDYQLRLETTPTEGD